MISEQMSKLMKDWCFSNASKIDVALQLSSIEDDNSLIEKLEPQFCEENGIYELNYAGSEAFMLHLTS